MNSRLLNTISIDPTMQVIITVLYNIDELILKKVTKKIKSIYGGYGTIWDDNGFDVDYGFNESISFVINYEDQKEIDYFWDKLSAVPEVEQCEKGQSH